MFKYLERCYGKEFADKALTNDFQYLMPQKINEKLIQKLTVTVPSRALIEKLVIFEFHHYLKLIFRYLVVIARHYSIEFTPDLTAFVIVTPKETLLEPTMEEQLRIDRLFKPGT